MAKRKLLIKDKEALIDIIAKYLDDKELKELKNKIIEKQDEFNKENLKDYLKTFNISNDIYNFALKYNILSYVYNCGFDYHSQDNWKIFDYRQGKNKNYIDEFCSFNYSFKLPYYDSLSYVYYGDENTTTSSCIVTKYRKFMKPYCEAVVEKSKKVIEMFNDIQKIIWNSEFVEDFEKIIDIQEVTDYVNNKFINKKSTALSTINQEKIDFIKNYLTSLK